MSSPSHQSAIGLPITDRPFRTLIFRKLSSLTGGHLRLREAWSGAGTQSFGRTDSDLQVSLTIHNPRFYRRAVLGGGLGAAEAFMDGDCACSDLTAFVRIFIRDLQVSDSLGGGMAAMHQQISRFGHWLRKNTVTGSRKNIAAHYDLGNNFYSLWLDETMNYSCGVFEHADATMRDASVAKMDRICRKLDLQARDHLVEIGTGWGAFAMHAAEHYGCRVTTTTISEEQHRLATQRIRQRGLEHQITVLKDDYRHLTGRFDKLVSIEMIEAVGHAFYPTFFRKCSDLLKPDGQMLLQSIVIADHRYEHHKRSVDFISKYIFPGGMLPSVSVITQTAANVGQLRLVQLEDFAPHYAETLRRWRTDFTDALGQIRQLGFDERFVRMWTYYLCYCEAAFTERQVNLVQMHLAKRECQSDPILRQTFSANQTDSRTCAAQDVHSEAFSQAAP